MKLAISVNEPQFDASLERRFGRCQYFVVVDTETRSWVAHPNPAADARGGAGPQAAQFLADAGVDAVLSGDYGPKAFKALEAAQISMYTAKAGTAEHLLGDFLAGEIQQVTESTGVQHHGRHT
jgi:predicted Fe-Mo cluster-binding NifX family protein